MRKSEQDEERALEPSPPKDPAPLMPPSSCCPCAVCSSDSGGGGVGVSPSMTRCRLEFTSEVSGRSTFSASS
jgi:hypothetical protein